MALSRRSFVHSVSAGAAGLWLSDRGREGAWFGETAAAQGGASPLILSSNENPLGCHPDVLAAVKACMTDAGRYPFGAAFELTALVAKAVVSLAAGRDGLAHVWCHHTSASLIVCENADPSVRRDLEARRYLDLISITNLPCQADHDFAPVNRASRETPVIVAAGTPKKGTKMDSSGPKSISGK